MNVNGVFSSSCDLFRKGKFTDCCELLQHTVDNCYLKTIITQDEVEFIILRNNLLICNCLVCILKIQFNFIYYILIIVKLLFVKSEDFIVNVLRICWQND